MNDAVNDTLRVRRTVSALLASLSLAPALASSILLATDTPAKPASGPAVTVSQQNVPKLKLKPTIALPDTLSVPGDTKTFVATVQVGGAPKAGMKVHYFIVGYGGLQNPDVLSGPDGKASLKFTVPDNFKAFNWTVKASIAETAETLSAETSAHLNIFKGDTMPVLGDLIWGTYGSETGAKHGTIIVKIVQNYGARKSILVPIQMTVNGNTWTIQPDILQMIALMPLDAKTWTVKASFLENESYTGSEATRTYHRPSGQ